eukprot:jgi/Bigna1/139511/aug1.51_g14219
MKYFKKIDTAKVVDIDPDRIKKSHREWRIDNGLRDRKKDREIHKWSVREAVAEFRSLTRKRESSLVLDSSGSDSEWLMTRMSRALAKGYQVELIYVRIPVEIAVVRNRQRMEAAMTTKPIPPNLHWVPEEIIWRKAAYLDPSFHLAKRYADRSSVVNNYTEQEHREAIRLLKEDGTLEAMSQYLPRDDYEFFTRYGRGGQRRRQYDADSGGERAHRRREDSCSSSNRKRDSSARNRHRNFREDDEQRIMRQRRRGSGEDRKGSGRRRVTRGKGNREHDDQDYERRRRRVHNSKVKLRGRRSSHQEIDDNGDSERARKRQRYSNNYGDRQCSRGYDGRDVSRERRRNLQHSPLQQRRRRYDYDSRRKIQPRIPPRRRLPKDRDSHDRRRSNRGYGR